MDVTLPEGATYSAPVRLYAKADHTGATVDASATVDDDNVLHITPPTSAVGRFYPRITYTTDGGSVFLDLPLIDLPIDETMLVSPESLAVKAGMDLPLSADQREVLTEAIFDAQSDVTAYLGRPILPTVYTETGRFAWQTGWDLRTAGDEPLIRVMEVTPELDTEGNPTNYFTITYLAGIDALNDPELRPIGRYVKAAAMNDPSFVRMWTKATKAKGDMKSLTTNGQSVTFEKVTLGGGGVAGSGAPGALPTLGSLDRWRLAGRRVYQAPTRARQFPYADVQDMRP